MNKLPLPWLLAGIVLGAIGTAAAVTPAEILKAYKKPNASQAVGLPLLEHPAVRCSQEAAGWMYFDVAMRQGGTDACVCVQDKDSAWLWVAFGNQGVKLGASQRECE